MGEMATYEIALRNLMDSMAEAAEEAGKEGLALKGLAEELVRCLSFQRCSHCGEHYKTAPVECILADHVEAHAALEAWEKHTNA